MANKPPATVYPGPAVPALRYAHIVGWGKALPERVLSNHDLEAIVETNDEWIVARTGIRERRIANESETTASLALKAAQRALKVANILPTDVDLIVVATSTPEHIFPSTASIVQDRLGANRAGAYDLAAACSGFVYALDMAAAKIRTGDIDTALVIGAETMSRVMNWTDRSTCILFGDGAGAVVLRGLSEPGGVMNSVLRSDGAGWDLLGLPTIGSREAYLPSRADQYDQISLRPTYEMHRLHMNGNEVYRFATRVVGDSIKEVMERAKLDPQDIGLIVPHQANQRILDHIAKHLKLPPDKVYSNVARYGNTSAASIPIALTEAIEEGRVTEGDYLIFTGFGGGLTWATILVKIDRLTGGEASKVMDARRRAIYWYAQRRRGFIRWWRKLARWIFKDPYPGYTEKDLDRQLDEREKSQPRRPS
jgi:3-oxoacyl-[acyl-carrier-protein] synthase-3